MDDKDLMTRLSRFNVSPPCQWHISYVINMDSIGIKPSESDGKQGLHCALVQGSYRLWNSGKTM